MKKQTKTGVAPTLKNLPVFDKAIFSLTQYTTVNTTIQRIQTMTKSRFSLKKNKENSTLEVIRTA